MASRRPRGRLKIAKTPRKSKKKSKSPETVDTCDHCGKPLKRVFARTKSSSVFAASVGVAADIAGDSVLYFCDSGCRNDHFVGADK